MTGAIAAAEAALGPEGDAEMVPEQAPDEDSDGGADVHRDKRPRTADEETAQSALQQHEVPQPVRARPWPWHGDDEWNASRKWNMRIAPLVAPPMLLPEGEWPLEYERRLEAMGFSDGSLDLAGSMEDFEIARTGRSRRHSV